MMPFSVEATLTLALMLQKSWGASTTGWGFSTSFRSPNVANSRVQFCSVSPTQQTLITFQDGWKKWSISVKTKLCQQLTANTYSTIDCLTGSDPFNHLTAITQLQKTSSHPTKPKTINDLVFIQCYFFLMFICRIELKRDFMYFYLKTHISDL